MRKSIILEDICDILTDQHIPWDNLNGKRILITGATGLIGSTLVMALLYYASNCENPPQVLALVRNPDKAARILGKPLIDSANLILVVGDVEHPVKIEGKVDYIIHAASQTSSLGFVNYPVETIRTAIAGTENLLNLAVEKQTSGFVYLSTMEIYGCPENDEKIAEDHATNLNTMSVRNCYPESKRLCENLCSCYSKEYGINIFVVRLSQTFGPGVQYKDNRVFAEFARCLIEKKNIILQTSGDTKRNYLYTGDAVRAILYVMLYGKNGEAYNAANEDTYCSIYEMASMVAQELGNGAISVERKIDQDISKFGYAPTLHMNLNTAKIQTLGWRPKWNLSEMFRRMIDALKEVQNQEEE